MFRRPNYLVRFELYVCLLAMPFSIAAQDKFKLACPQPNYPEPATSGLAIDAQCGVQGAGTEVNSNPAEGQQNAAKNNFCAQEEGGAVKTSDMKNLQDKVAQDPSINWGEKKGPTEDRTKLRNLGALSEGKVVVFTGDVLKASQEGGESVNCELGKKGKGAAVNALHDTHIQLVDSKGISNECQSIRGRDEPASQAGRVDSAKRGKSRDEGITGSRHRPAFLRLEPRSPLHQWTASGPSHRQSSTSGAMGDSPDLQI